MGSEMDNPANWDAIFLKLPAAACGGGKADSVQCLSDGAKQQLEWDLDAYVSKKLLIPGVENVYKRPGSLLQHASALSHRTLRTSSTKSMPALRAQVPPSSS